MLRVIRSLRASTEGEKRGEAQLLEASDLVGSGRGFGRLSRESDQLVDLEALGEEKETKDKHETLHETSLAPGPGSLPIIVSLFKF